MQRDFSIAGQPNHPTPPPDSPCALKVLIAGGGCAALEAAFRLQRVGEDKIDTTILAPDEYFETQAFAVLVPFAAGHVPRESLADMASAAGARLRRGRLASVEPGDHRVVTDEGETIGYDALLIAVGAVKHAPYARVLTFGAPDAEELMHGLVQDLEAGYVRRIAFVVPEDASWPVPLYELALMTAERGYAMGQNCELTLITWEEAPLALFGPETSRAMEVRLAHAGVAVITGVHADVPRAGLVALGSGGSRLSVDRIIALSALQGPGVEGLPSDARGFLSVDRHGRVVGVPDVYAAGDATSAPIKQGGLACQQADAAAESIAARAGAAIDPQPYRALLQGVLLTERHATFMRRTAEAGGEDAGALTRDLCWPPTKIAGRELTRHISDLPRRSLA